MNTARSRFAPIGSAPIVAWLASTLLGCSGAIEPREAGPRAPEQAGPAGQAAATSGSGGSAGAAGSDPFAGMGATAGTPAPGSCETSAEDSGEAPLRRLSSLEYQLTLEDLFQLGAPPSIEGVPADAEKDGFTSYAELQALSAQHLRGYLEVAGRLASELLADEARSARVIGCALDEPQCLQGFVELFGRRAYRRPLSTEEQSAIVGAAEENALDLEDQYRYAIEALLASPSFLYRVEVGMGEALATLDGYELASRLSFALHGRGPTDALLDKARDGTLETADGLASEITSLLMDPRTETFLSDFFVQWLGFTRLRTPKQPAADFSEDLLADMTEETRAVVNDFAFGGRDFLDVLTTNETRVSPALGSYYDLPPPAADGRVTMPESHPRAHTGLLTHAALISKKSDGDSIALRGNWLRKTFLCRGLSVPPEIAATFGERLVGLTRTEIVRERNTDDGCRGCHAMIDPIGVGFEAFDESGRYQEGVDITPFGITPALPDAPNPEFTSIAELSSKLRALPEVAACVTERAFLFAHGREPSAEDLCYLERAAKAFTDSGHDFRALVRALVEAPELRLRRAPTLP